MRDNAARLSGYLLQRQRRRPPMVYAEGKAVRARPRRRPSWRRLIRLRWRPYEPGPMDVLLPATACAAVTVAAFVAFAATLAGALGGIQQPWGANHPPPPVRRQVPQGPAPALTQQMVQRSPGAINPVWRAVDAAALCTATDQGAFLHNVPRVQKMLHEHCRQESMRHAFAVPAVKLGLQSARAPAWRVPGRPLLRARRTPAYGPQSEHGS